MPPNNRMPSATGSAASGSGQGPVATGDPSSTWEMWDCIRTLCGYHPRLSVSEYSSIPSFG